MVSNLSLDSLLDPVVEIAREAGQAVLEIYAGGNFQTTYKADKSPLTQADLAANDIIIKRLHSLTPSIPIISEESLDIETSNRQTSAVIWLVDPLDGTKEFINKNGEFTVNIGLIQAGVPVLGVVYAPAHQLLYYGARHIGAWKQIIPGDSQKIIAKPIDNELVVAISRLHQNVATTQFLKTLPSHRQLTIGSSLKLCYVADGTVGLYPRLGLTMEWDTAAADAIVRAAGGMVDEYEGQKPLKYNKLDLHNPFFIAHGDGVIS